MVRVGLILCLLLAACSSSEDRVEPAHGIPGLVQPPVSALLNMDGLLALKEKASVVVIAVDPIDVFAQSHLKDARQVWRPDICSEAYTYGGMALEREKLAALMDSLGVHASSHVVLYDQDGGCDAARLWWMLTFYGQDQVYLLDGDTRTHRTYVGLPEEKEWNNATGRYTFPLPVDSSWYASYSDVLQALSDSTALILDTRSWDETAGIRQKKGAARAGRIPGAVWWDWVNAHAPDSDVQLATKAEIVASLNAAGVHDLTAYEKVITYCHSGVRSAHTAFVLREVLGVEQVSNYDGSWTEWSHMPDAPIEVLETQTH